MNQISLGLIRYRLFNDSNILDTPSNGKITRPWLIEHYVNQHLSTSQIGKLLRKTRQAIWKRLKAYHIPIRAANRKENWKISQGYYWIKDGTHPRSNNGYIKRSILVLERKLGRTLLPEEFPHHKDNNRLNDIAHNLEVTNRSDHMRIHKLRTRKGENYG